jgi:hypothetical protein
MFDRQACTVCPHPRDVDGRSVFGLIVKAQYRSRGWAEGTAMIVLNTAT